MTDHTFSVKEAASLLDLTPSEVRSFARAGLDPAAGDESAGSGFGFRDLVVLRMAAGLRRAQIPRRRITNALAGLRRTEGRDVAGLHLEALGDHVVVRDGEVVWRADSGQFDLGLGGEPARETRESSVGSTSVDVHGCLDRARELEGTDPASAAEWYAHAIESDSTLWEAWAGLGFALQQTGRPADAVESYRKAAKLDADATVSFNLGVALDDLGRLEEARDAYGSALEIDPDLADAHFNLSCLQEKLGDRSAALRHMIAYRECATKG